MKNPTFDCPECGCPNDKLVFYKSILFEGKAADRYQCNECGRDAACYEVKLQSAASVFGKMKIELNDTADEPPIEDKPPFKM